MLENPDSAALPRFDNSYSRLSDAFFTRIGATPVAAPSLVAFNRELAEQLGFSNSFRDDEHRAAVFGGNETLPGMEPIAAVYAGHQFGGFTPQLGDGRAILLGEVLDVDGRRFDVQLKGSGRTPYSRGGDGRAALGPVLREYLISEAMHALGIPTTRALAAVTTGEPVFRETTLPGAIVTRVASSHVRVGTFQFFASRREADSVRELADHVLARHYPELVDEERPYLALLAAVGERQAKLVARWMGVGFVHGVMNTDNTAISGETIDYGPCAFLDYYDAQACFSSIDRRGRYAFSNQASIAQWNLVRLAESLLELIDPVEKQAIELATEAVRRFADVYEESVLDVMRAKLGLSGDAQGADEDSKLVDALLEAMQAGRADYTRTFRALCNAVERVDRHEDVRALFANGDAYDAWAVRFDARGAKESRGAGERARAMRGHNPSVVPRNYHVEEVLRAAVEDADHAPFWRLHELLARPYEDVSDADAFARAGPDDQSCYRTFCGT